jgi:hypothetical protein
MGKRQGNEDGEPLVEICQLRLSDFLLPAYPPRSIEGAVSVLQHNLQMKHQNQ